MRGFRTGLVALDHRSIILYTMSMTTNAKLVLEV